MNFLKYRGAWLFANVCGRRLPLETFGKGTRVLMFHDVSEGPSTGDIYSVPRDLFTRQIQLLASWAESNKIPFIPLNSKQHGGIAVTFDDGYKSTLAIAEPLLREFGIPFHVFVSRELIESGLNQYLNRQDVRLLAKCAGVELGTHGHSHCRLTSLDDESLQQHLSESRLWLEELTGREITSMSYPFGDYDERVVAISQRCGYRHAACSKSGTYTETTQDYWIPRIDIWAHDSPRTVIDKTAGNWDVLMR